MNIDWKKIVKPVAKMALKFGLNYGLNIAADKVKEKPEKGEQICADVASLGDLIKSDAEAIKDGEFDDTERKASEDKCDILVERLFNY